MNEKERFAVLAETGRFTISELCRDFGISRKTGHKYLKRYRNQGRAGLTERSRRPKSSPAATAEEVERLVHFVPGKTSRPGRRQVLTLDKWGFFYPDRRMARPLRVVPSAATFAGGCYHVINRANYRRRIFEGKRVGGILDYGIVMCPVLALESISGAKQISRAFGGVFVKT